MNDVSKELKQMVEEFQCPGCVCGSDTTCKAFDYSPSQMRCMGHVLGTISAGAGNFALGLPKGFCKPGWSLNDKGEFEKTLNRINVRLWPDSKPDWNRLNIPVWALEKDGYLFVRTYAPRINVAWVDVIKGGTLAMVPQAVNVADFVDSID